MTSPLAINSIHAKSDLAIRNDAGKFNQTKTQFEAWSTTNIAETGKMVLIALLHSNFPVMPRNATSWPSK